MVKVIALAVCGVVCGIAMWQQFTGIAVSMVVLMFLLTM